jgi:hypothetical protein
MNNLNETKESNKFRKKANKEMTKDSMKDKVIIKFKCVENLQLSYYLRSFVIWKDNYIYNSNDFGKTKGILI